VSTRKTFAIGLAAIKPAIVCQAFLPREPFHFNRERWRKLGPQLLCRSSMGAVLVSEGQSWILVPFTSHHRGWNVYHPPMVRWAALFLQPRFGRQGLFLYPWLFFVPILGCISFAAGRLDTINARPRRHY